MKVQVVFSDCYHSKNYPKYEKYEFELFSQKFMRISAIRFLGWENSMIQVKNLLTKLWTHLEFNSRNDGAQFDLY